MATRVTQVVTFATGPFRGNPAFVVSFERDTPSKLLQAVAAQLGDGVVAVLGPQDGDAIRLRFVTATGPHPGAGHAAAAAAAVLIEARSSVDVAFEDGTRRRFWRDDEHVVVPWPPMPFAACALGPTLGLLSAGCLSSASPPSSGMCHFIQRRLRYAIWRPTWRPWPSSIGMQ